MAENETIWMVCPNLWGARFFEYTGAEAVRFVREFARPTLQTKREDFQSNDEVDEILEPIEDPEFERQVANTYLEQVSEELERSVDRYDGGLVLCAEQHLLDIFLGKLGPAARQKLLGTVALDLYEANESDLLSYVGEVISRAERSRGAPDKSVA